MLGKSGLLAIIQRAAGAGSDEDGALLRITASRCLICSSPSELLFGDLGHRSGAFKKDAAQKAVLGLQG
jgi:hypothetical protein